MSEEVSAPARLLFNRWDTGEVTIRDPGIARYVNLNSMIVPHSCGRLTRQEFHKANMLIVERLINQLMRTEVNTGKKQLAIRIVRDAFEIINQKTKRIQLKFSVMQLQIPGLVKRLSVSNMVVSMCQSQLIPHLCAGSIPLSV
jgi:Ribosomal protein S7